MNEAAEHSAPTDEEANAALDTILGRNVEPERRSVQESARAEDVERPSSFVNYAPEDQAADEPAVTEEQEAKPTAESDDVESLKSRYEAQLADYQRRMDAIQQRSRQNQELMQTKYLTKSSQHDRMRQVLEKALRSEEGVDKAEVERLLAEAQSSYNPQSANYAPPAYQPAPPPNEDAAIAVNDFLNEKGISAEDASKFGEWVRSSGHTLTQRDLALAERDAYAFMYAAWPKFQESRQAEAKPAEPDITARAIKSVQKVQKASARAASTAPSIAGGNHGSPRPVKPNEISDTDLAAAMRALGGGRY